MGHVPLKYINTNFFQTWNHDMAYVLGYFVADGCISVTHGRRQPYTINITSKDKSHLQKIRRVMDSEHKISRKTGNAQRSVAYQLQVRNYALARDLIKRGIKPRKTYNLEPIKIPSKYFSDFIRGFFDGDGSVYIYTVNGVPQIKAGFISTSYPFLNHVNRLLCRFLDIPNKAIHIQEPNAWKRPDQKLTKYTTAFYIDDCDKLEKFFYGNKPRLFLTRKHRIFQKWKQMKRRNYQKHSYPSKIGWHLNKKI